MTRIGENVGGEPRLWHDAEIRLIAGSFAPNSTRRRWIVASLRARAHGEQ